MLPRMSDPPASGADPPRVAPLAGGSTAAPASGASAPPVPGRARLTPHVGALDGLRALAVMLVVLTHAAFLTGTADDGLAGRLMARGDFGVAIFFGLSGYLLHRGLLREAASPSASLRRAGLRGYALRRAARVLPAYWLTLTVVVAVTGPPWRDVVLHALGAQIYVAGSQLDSFSQSWSLATELSFYAALPLVVMILRPVRRRRPGLPLTLLLGAGVVLTLAGGLTESADLARDVPYERWLPARAPNFLVGMILAEAAVRPGHPISTRLRALAALPGPVLGLGAAAYVLATSSLTGVLTLGVTPGWHQSVKTLLSCVVTGALMVPLILGPPGGLGRALGAPLPAWLGRVSYGIFLWHLPVFTALLALSGIETFTGGLLPLLIFGGAITLVLAAASYHWVELPAMRWAAGRSAAGARRRPAAARPE